MSIPFRLRRSAILVVDPKNWFLRAFGEASSLWGKDENDDPNFTWFRSIGAFCRRLFLSRMTLTNTIQVQYTVAFSSVNKVSAHLPRPRCIGADKQAVSTKIQSREELGCEQISASASLVSDKEIQMFCRRRWKGVEIPAVWAYDAMQSLFDYTIWDVSQPITRHREL